MRKHTKVVTELSPETPLFYTNYKEPLKEASSELGGDYYGYMGTLASNKDLSHVQCHICGNLYEVLGGRNGHLQTAHNISAKEYKDKFGLSQSTALVGETTRAKLIKAGTLGAEASAARAKEAQEGLLRYWQDVKSGKRERHKVRKEWSKERRNIEGNCPDQLLDQIKELADKFGRTPTQKEFQLEARSSLQAVKTTFGSWQAAVKLLGLEPRLHWRERGPIMTSEQCLESLRIFYDLYKRTPRASDFKRGLLPNMRLITRYFETLNEARLQAGIPVLIPVGGGITRRYLEIQADEVKHG